MPGVCSLLAEQGQAAARAGPWGPRLWQEQKNEAPKLPVVLGVEWAELDETPRHRSPNHGMAPLGSWEREAQGTRTGFRSLEGVRRSVGRAGQGCRKRRSQSWAGWLSLQCPGSNELLDVWPGRTLPPGQIGCDLLASLCVGADHSLGLSGSLSLLEHWAPQPPSLCLWQISRLPSVSVGLLR